MTDSPGNAHTDDKTPETPHLIMLIQVRNRLLSFHPCGRIEEVLHGILQSHLLSITGFNITEKYNKSLQLAHSRTLCEKWQYVHIKCCVMHFGTGTL